MADMHQKVLNWIEFLQDEKGARWDKVTEKGLEEEGIPIETTGRTILELIDLGKVEEVELGRIRVR